MGDTDQSWELVIFFQSVTRQAILPTRHRGVVLPLSRVIAVLRHALD